MKKKIEERLLEELQFKAKRAEIAPDKFSFTKGGTLLTGESYYNEIASTMVDVVDIDEKGFLYLKINPKIPRDILHYLIDKAIDEYPEEVLEHKAKHPDITMREFLDRYYPSIVVPVNGYPIFIPTLPSKPAKKSKTRFNAGKYDIWEIYKLHQEGLNTSQIARHLSGHKGNPSYNENLMSVVKQVERALKKARKEIKPTDE